jgi:hypothetical protein
LFLLDLAIRSAASQTMQDALIARPAKYYKQSPHLSLANL